MPSQPGFSLDIQSLRAGYERGARRPADVIEEVLERIERRGNDAVWITVRDRERLLAEARKIERRQAAGDPMPLYGILFAVKDNIDVAGVPTTVACPPFAYTPEENAPVVARLIAAGALCIGKTNLDQFATGLVGVRSPYGVPKNPFDERYIVGGSSSGSAVAVAVGEVSFALGTDTAGSGRVPAAFNNIVGLKPSRGLFPTTGVVPACRSFDCISIFALTVEDAAAVAKVAAAYDPEDPASRKEADGFPFTPQVLPAPLPAGGNRPGEGPSPPLPVPLPAGGNRPGEGPSPPLPVPLPAGGERLGEGPSPLPSSRPPHFRFGVPRGDGLDFLGDDQAAAVFAATIEQLAALGGEKVELDFTPFRKAGALLYDGPFVAERLVAAGRILTERPDALVPPLRAIFEAATRIDAKAAFEGEHKLALLRRRADAALEAVDLMVVPTAPTIYRIEDVLAEPRKLNATLGTYTNFVNLLDLCGVAVPGGFRPDGLPAGVTLVGKWGRDGYLAGIAAALHRATSTMLGATGAGFPERPAVEQRPEPGMIGIAVVGAHLSGQPLNHQLVELGGRLVRQARTAPAYRLYALADTTPAKPGLTHVPAGGVPIELEVWSLTPAAFGTFVSRIPPPLCIGKIELEDGTLTSGFLCEPRALTGARDISSFGGWRAYRRSLS